MRSYASWKLLRDVARRAEHNDLNANAAGSARARLRSAIELTTWLHEQDRTLADLRQDLLEGWLLEGGSSRLAIAGFIEWLRKTKVISGLHVPRAPRPLKLNTVQDSKRWALLGGCWATRPSTCASVSRAACCCSTHSRSRRSLGCAAKT